MKYKDIYKYCDQCNDSISLPNVFKMKRDNDFGYAVEESEQLVLCFAGSNDFKDWMENIQFFRLTEGNTIHKGFYDAWQSFKDQVTLIVNEYLQRKPNGNILVTGHSRGGGLAILCARHIGKNLKKSCKLVTFGAPMLGDKKYRDEFELLPIDATCLQNGWDIVCYLPPEQFDFYKVGKLLILTQNIFHKLPWLRISDHLEYKKVCDKRDI